MEAVLPKAAAIFLGTLFLLSTIAAGVVAADLHATMMGDGGPGRWHISAGPGPAVWKLNTQTVLLHPRELLQLGRGGDRGWRLAHHLSDASRDGPAAGRGERNQRRRPVAQQFHGRGGGLAAKA